MPKWTNTKPTIDGWYWLYRGFGDPVIIAVEAETNIYYYFGHATIFPLEKRDGSFYGPLKPPKRT